MLEFVNNFYASRFIFIIIMVIVSLAVVDTMKKKQTINIKDKLNFKKIDLNFLSRIITLSFTFRVLLEQTIYLLPIKETVSNIPLNFLTILVEIIVTCLFAPICEEIICRFGIYEYLNKKIKTSLIAMILASFIFSVIHFYGIDGLIIIFFISLIWNYAYVKTNNLIYPIVLHFLNNIYAMVGYMELGDTIYILFGIVSLIIYIILKIKSSSKNTTTG